MPETMVESSGSVTPNAKPAVAYFAKVPAPGRTKTRLCPPLSFAEAAGLYCGFLADVLQVVEGARTLVYAWPPTELAEMVGLVPDAIELRGQHGDGLWARMTAAMADLFDEGHPVVLIRNTDSPDLPPERVAEALTAAAPGKVVLGPDASGGYYLIALCEPCPALFETVEEGAATVFEVTCARALELGLEVVSLPVERDVDSFDDLIAMWESRRRRKPYHGT